MGLVDIMNVKRGTTEFATHITNKQNRRIDYVLGPPSLVPGMKGCGCEPFHLTFKVDHRGVFIDFYDADLHGSTVHELMKPALSGVNSRDKNNQILYMKEKCGCDIYNNMIGLRP